MASLFEDERETCADILPVDDAHANVLHVIDQLDFRLRAVLDAMCSWGYCPDSLDAVVGRGGMLSPVPSGTYLVNDLMLDEMRAMGPREHASNLGCVIADSVARRARIPAFIVDPVSVDEFDPIARVAGLPGIERLSQSHALNTKSAARYAADVLGKPYAETNLIVAHLGSGISVSAHRLGRMVDVNQGLDGTGPFSPERAGGLPIGDVMRMAFSGQYTYAEMFRLVTRRGGLYAHLGTNDARLVEQRIRKGDEHARLIFEAMAYQIAKEIGLMATVVNGEVDAVVLTGNLANSQLIVRWVQDRVRFIGPIIVVAGQREMLAMAQGTMRVLAGCEEAKEYPTGESIDRSVWSRQGA